MKSIQEYCYGFHAKGGDLIIYGDNVKICRPYLDDISTDFVEDVCEYCSQHNIRIFHKFDRSIGGLIALVEVYILTKKYNVRSSWKELVRYLESE